MLYPAELRRRIYSKEGKVYRTAACAEDAQQMAKSLASLGCHLHAACGRCIQLSYGDISIEENGYRTQILRDRHTQTLYAKTGGMSRKNVGLLLRFSAKSPFTDRAFSDIIN